MADAPGISEVRIRTARAGDAAALADLCTQLGYPSSQGELAERLQRILGEPDHVVFVADLPGRGVCGFLHGFCGIALETGPRAEILGLVTADGQRGRGIGRRLVAEAEEWAREKGHQAITVRCNVVRNAAHAFYEGLGFACTKTQKHFRKSL
jgi:GNAT superfamily N-acetyltransferase